MKFIKASINCGISFILLFLQTGQMPDSEDSTGVKNIFTPHQKVIELDWNSHPDGIYSDSMAVADFGVISGWNSRVHIEEKAIKVTLPADKLSGAGGIVSNVGLKPGRVYRVSYDVMFPSDFQWGRGGKVGFGLRIGDGNAGCDRADDGNGGSARMMWYTNSHGITKLKPYLYYRDMLGLCGDNLIHSAAYPILGNLQKQRWYTITMQVKSNRNNYKDGHVKVSVDGNTVLNHAIRWTTNNTKSFINRLAFSTFRGGSGDSWKIAYDSHIYFDNLKVEKLD